MSMSAYDLPVNEIIKPKCEKLENKNVILMNILRFGIIRFVIIQLAMRPKNDHNGLMALWLCNVHMSENIIL